MKSKWSMLAIAVPVGAAVALLALVLVAYDYGNQPSMSDMEAAAELGAVIGGLLTFAWPVRLLMR